MRFSNAAFCALTGRCSRLRSGSDSRMRRLLLAVIGLMAGLSGCNAEEGLQPSSPPPQPTATGTATTPPTNTAQPPMACQGRPTPAAPIALLTRREYDNTVLDLLGDTTKPASTFPPENQVQGFSNFTGVHQASPLLVEKYLEAAEAAAQRAVSRAGSPSSRRAPRARTPSRAGKISARGRREGVSKAARGD